jgi:hypothetical protein
MATAVRGKQAARQPCDWRRARPTQRTKGWILLWRPHSRDVARSWPRSLFDTSHCRRVSMLFHARARIPDLPHRLQVDPIQTPAAPGQSKQPEPRSTGHTRSTDSNRWAIEPADADTVSEPHGRRACSLQWPPGAFGYCRTEPGALGLLSCSLREAVPATDLGPAWAGAGALLVEMLDAHADTAIRADRHRLSLIVVACAFVAVHRERFLHRMVHSAFQRQASPVCSTPRASPT